MRRPAAATIAATFAAASLAAQGQPAAGLRSADLHALRSVSDVQLSPDGSLLAYSITNSDGPGAPYSQVWIMDTATGQSKRLGGEKDTASGPRWSRDGKRIAYFGENDQGSGVMVAQPDGTGAAFVAPVTGTNHSLPSTGARLAWSPDAQQIAYLSATPGPETEATGDPVVITRYLYKPPTAAQGPNRFNDNRRLHIFVADTATKQTRQLTTGNYYEHSIDWSPAGDEILFVSNREPDPDRFFNYDLFTVKVDGGSVRRLTETKNAEYRPTWSPDGKTIAYQGTTRELTSSETTMEDTHVWRADADGRNRRDLGGAIDNRQGAPAWSPDGKWLYFTVQTRGSTHLYRLPAGGGAHEAVLAADGSLGAWSVGRMLAYAHTTARGPAELFLKRDLAVSSITQMTTLNERVLAKKALGEVSAFTFKSFDGTEIGAFLTAPAHRTDTSRHPLIVMIHGGPHGQQGPAFNAKAQIYAAEGWASLMVNYRGSTGYGQKLADAIFKDQNGGEAKDVMAGVDAALEKFKWLDGTRLGIEGGSYGGQLTNWIITQTDRFKAAVPSASISNLVTQNYLSYYHDYLAVEFGGFPHQNGLVDELWKRSAIRLANKVKTPVMFVHGENDNNVPIAEAEQFFIALKDVGVETIMVRYPREGHGLRETKHLVDVADRSIAWYKKWFDAGGKPTAAR